MALPLWTSRALLDAPGVVERIHRRYTEAGAEILTAGTFRTQRRTLASAGLPDLAEELTRTAVALARRAAAGVNAAAHTGPPLVAGSASPLEDCYRPDLAPARAVLEQEHREHAQHLDAAGVDLILVETMNSAIEARAAAEAAAETGLPFLVSFACREGSGETGRRENGALLSGEPLSTGIEAVRDRGPLAVLVNCTPPSALDACLATLGESGLPFGCYPNLGAPRADGLPSEPQSPEAFATLATGWVARGAALVGGCCGTGPEHVRALAAALTPSTTSSSTISSTRPK